MMLGDMYVQGKPPGKLVKALSVVASTLHQEYDRLDWLLAGKSKESCVLASLTVRDFFRRIGFTDVQMTPVYLAIEAVDKDGKFIHSVGVGDHIAAGQAPAKGDGWDGHVCVRIPKLSYLVDTTVYQTIRPQWHDLPGMFAMPYAREPEQKVLGMTPMAGITRANGNGDRMKIVWLDQPANESWRKAPDRQIERRQDVVKTMVKRFGNWKDR
jgi:hypothetical protein